MAKRIGYEFWIDMSGLHWHRRYLEGDPVREFLYRTDPGVGSIIGQPQLVTNIKENVSTLVLLARDPKTRKISLG